MNSSEDKSSLDYTREKYAHHVAGLDLTKEQSDELISAIANIMMAFVDMGFGIGPSQTPCGQVKSFNDLLPKILPDLLNCENSNTAAETVLADRTASAEQEGS